MSAIQNARRSRRRDSGHIEDVTQREDLAAIPYEPTWKKRKVFLGLLLLPICSIVLIALGEMIFTATVKGAFWRNEGFLFFFMGCAGWFALTLFSLQPVKPYVFAHEMTHVFATYLSLGRVGKIEIGEEGGYIEASKTNWFITLAPYMIPLYTVVVFALYGCASLVWNLQFELNVPLYFWSVIVKPAWLFYFWIGVTWSFHISFTYKVLQQEQSDLNVNGEFFSMMLIFLFNIAVLGFLFILASPQGQIDAAWLNAQGMTIWMYSTLWSLISWSGIHLWQLIVWLTGEAWIVLKWIAVHLWIGIVKAWVWARK